MKVQTLIWQTIVLVLLLAAAPVVAEGAKWVRRGLEWSVQLPPPQFVDQIRVKKQMASGCGGSLIKFGDTAPMRGWPADLTWPAEVRKLTASAALVDDSKRAYSLLGQVLDRTDLDDVQRAILENQLILTALQFNEPAEALRLMSLYGMPDTLPAPLRSDRLFWAAIYNQETSSAQQWRSNRLPQLDAAMNADPSSFQVRVWRVIGWLEAEGWKDKACGDAISAFSSRLLDLSDAGACPLMISHFSHASNLHFGKNGSLDAATDQAVWRHFATGLLAIIAKDDETAESLRVTLTQASDKNQCANQMAVEIGLLESGK